MCAPHAEQGAVFAQRSFDLERLLARLSRDEQVLVAILDPLHRSAEVDGCRQHRDVLAGRQHLHAERAADVLRGDARHRDRIPREQTEEHAREVRDAHGLAQEQLRHGLARRRRRLQSFTDRLFDEVDVLRRLVVLLGSFLHGRAFVGGSAMALPSAAVRPCPLRLWTRDVDERLPHRPWRPVSAARDQFIRWLFCVAEWYSTVPMTGSTSATHPRVSIGWFE